MRHTLKFISLICITALLASCKVAVIVPEGGEVGSFGLVPRCVANSVCISDVVDTNYESAFWATPDPGWYFHHWNSGDRFICGGSRYTTCEISWNRFLKNEAIERAFASSEVFYVMPVFKNYPLAVKVDDRPRTIKVDGKEWQWLEAADFENYSYNQFNRACPAGICSGTLPGSTIDLTGYIWASSGDVRLLLEAYEIASIDIFEDFQPTFSYRERDGGYGGYLDVMLSDLPFVHRPRPDPEYSNTYLYFAHAIIAGVYEDGRNYEITKELQELDLDAEYNSAWFYRPSD